MTVAAAAAVGALVALGAGCGSDAVDPGPPEEDFRVLVFSRTLGFRHASIPDGQALVRDLGQAEGFGVDVTEDPSVFRTDVLAGYAVVVFLSTSGDVLDPVQQEAFEAWVGAGGGFVGVHAAADTEYDWPWYGGLVGAYFANHPAIQPAVVRVEDAAHGSTAHLPAAWSRTDEWYDFQSNPRGRANVLLTLDEASYEGGIMGDDHPIAWYHEYDGGRAWYSALGHTAATYDEPLYARHLLGGILWAAGVAP